MLRGFDAQGGLQKTETGFFLSSGQQGHNVIFYMSQDNINIK